MCRRPLAPGGHLHDSFACVRVPCVHVQVLKKICWYIVLTPAYSTEAGSSSDHTTLLKATLQVSQPLIAPQRTLR